MRFLEKVKPRVVTMHASDRYLAPGRDARRSARSATAPIGYSDKLRHGETGQGLNDYDAIFRILAGVGFAGWISVEDGMNGLDELARSVAFLKQKRAVYYGDWRHAAARSAPWRRPWPTGPGVTATAPSFCSLLARGLDAGHQRWAQPLPPLDARRPGGHAGHDSRGDRGA